MKKEDNFMKMFENTNIRTVWDSEKGDYYFSVVDVIEVLIATDSSRKY